MWNVVSVTLFKLGMDDEKVIRSIQDRKRKNAATKIQAFARGSLCRNRLMIKSEFGYMYRRKTKLQGTARSAKNFASQDNNVSFESPSVKLLSSKITKSVKILSEKSSNVGQLILGKAQKALTGSASSFHQQAVDYVKDMKQNQELQNRRKDCIVMLNDGLVNLRGASMMQEIPVLERQWYVEVFPQLHGPKLNLERTNITNNDEGGEDAVTLTLKRNKFELPPDGPAFEMNGLENSSSAKVRTLDTKSWTAFSYFLHCADLSRYHSVGIVVYVETNNSVLTTELMHTSSTVSMKGLAGMSSSQSQVDNRRRFTIAFYGQMPLYEGRHFGPCGGRMRLTLKPHVEGLLVLPHSRKLLELQGLDMLITFLPVALPSSGILRTFCEYHRPLPCYPTSYVDAEALHPTTVQWDTLNAAVHCIGSFRQRIIVSCKSTRVEDRLRLIEYSAQGMIERAGLEDLSQRKDLGDRVTHILTGHKHVALCTNTGKVVVLMEDASAPVTARKRDQDSEEGNSVTSDDAKQSMLPKLAVKFAFPAHNIGIVCGCVLAHAGMDILFTVDKLNALAVNFLDEGQLLKSFTNDRFLPDQITYLCAFENRLYLATTQGQITTINLSPALEGSIEQAANLRRHILHAETITRPHVPSTPVDEIETVTAMIVYAPNQLLGLQNEDTLRRREEIRVSTYLSTAVDPIRYDVLEGHVLAVGGGDANPVIRLYHPHPKRLREVVTLQGHKHGITQLCVDAAGRYIFSSSARDHTILVWDGLSFTCERQFENVNVSVMCLSHNCLSVGSFKSPYLSMWTTLYALNNENGKIYRNRGEFALDIRDGTYNTQIATVRSSRWCYGVLKGTQYQAVKAVVEPKYIDEYGQVAVERWLTAYERKDAPEAPSVVAKLRTEMTSTKAQSFGFSQSTKSVRSGKELPGRGLYASGKYGVGLSSKSGKIAPEKGDGRLAGGSSKLSKKMGKALAAAEHKSKRKEDREEEKEASDDTASKTVKSYWSLRQFNKRRVHFSDSDEEEEERVRYYGKREPLEVLLGAAPQPRRASEELVDAMTAVRVRQEKLRPRMTLHLNDAWSDSSEEAECQESDLSEEQ